MGKKLEKNGMWESSRMMLPEHREQILLSNRNLEKRIIPTLHEDEWELYLRILNESFYSKKTIKVVVFDEFDPIEYVGTVGQIDQQKSAIKLDNVWIYFNKIIKVRDIR